MTRPHMIRFVKYQRQVLSHAVGCREAIVEFLLGRCSSFADEEAEVSRAEAIA